MDRRARGLLAGASLVAGAAALLSTATPACLPAGKCDASWSEYCLDAGGNCQGHLIDAYTWESGPIDGDFMEFPHERNWFMHLRDGRTGALIAGRNIGDITVQLSAVQRPSDPYQRFAEASGNLTQIHLDGDQALDALNDTCADYFVRVLVHNVPDADAGPADAASE